MKNIQHSTPINREQAFNIQRPTRAVLALCFLLSALCFALTACKSPTLERGGAYAPTNEVGVLLYNDTGLALADASYKFAYTTVFEVLKFERDNRAELWAISPNIKHNLDKLRPQIVDADKRWAQARLIYRAKPTPAGLTGLQRIIAEIQRLVPVAQSQLGDAMTKLATPEP